MNTPLITIAAIVALALLYVLAPEVLYTFQSYRKKRVLRCPETGGWAEVDIDAPRAAFSSIVGNHLLRVKNCTLWPKRKGCRERCLRQRE